ncbi:MAG: NUDIX domain-containing protein [Chloroflexi bacterium]|nr:NUDIX domain-containing protein [Chloroflexota bacterium]
MFTDFESCPMCRGSVTIRTVDGQWRPYCAHCRLIIQLGPKLVATVLIGDPSKLLMVQRSYGEEKGRWALPGGYVEQGEVVEEAAAREAVEETGIEVTITGLVGLFSASGRPIVVAAYGATAVGGALTTDSWEIDGAGYFSVDNLPPLAFPQDDRIIAKWVEMVNGQR